jgi:large subunit ribosomal protein L32
MAVPKRKKSKSKTRMRRAQLKATITASKACPQCGASQQSHRVCPSCGYYRGRQVVTVQAD